MLQHFRIFISHDGKYYQNLILRNNEAINDGEQYPLPPIPKILKIKGAKIGIAYSTHNGSKIHFYVQNYGVKQQYPCFEQMQDLFNQVEQTTIGYIDNRLIN